MVWPREWVRPGLNVEGSWHGLALGKFPSRSRDGDEKKS